ncbi:MAG: O-antigen ligase family protein [Syntrophomonadaceae bacterium]|nr:O-antigen ligase family protein [Syntrophomonadaceae bacterium]
MKRETTADNPIPPARLHLNLRPFYIGGLALLLVLAPLQRGLFFRAELLGAAMLAAVVFAVAAADRALRGQPLQPEKPADWAALALLAAYALSLGGAVHPGEARLALLEAAAGVMVYLAASWAARTERALDLLLQAAVLGGTLTAAVGLLAAAQVLAVPGAYESGVIASTLQYRNTLGILMVACALLAVGLSVKREGLLPRLAAAFCTCLMVLALVGSQSRGALLLLAPAALLLVLAVPAALRWRALYHLFIPAGSALLASHWLFAALRAGDHPRALAATVAGLGLALALQACYWALGARLNRATVSDRTRRLVAAGGLAYCLLVAAVYLAVSSTAHASPQANLLPPELQRRTSALSAGDHSVVAREAYMRDAVRIMLDHPLTGAGGGGWNALYHRYQSELYWSSEAHSSLLQTGVEAGLPGMAALLALWGLAGWQLARFLRHAPRDGRRLSVAAAAVAAGALVLHSTFDFDFSFPAVAWLAMALLGAVSGAARTRRQERRGAEHAPGWQVALTAAAGTAAALAVLAFSYQWYTAGVEGALGARALQAKQLETAQAHYQRACALDPWTASYAADLAQVYTARALQADDARLHYQALAAVRAAAAAEPYNTELRAVLVNTCLALHEPALAAQHARAVVHANPLLAQGYELVAATRLHAARAYLQAGLPRQAEPFLASLQPLQQEMEVRGLSPSGAFALAAGQLDLLAGRQQEGRERLQQAAACPETRQEAARLLAMAGS